MKSNRNFCTNEVQQKESCWRLWLLTSWCPCAKWPQRERNSKLLPDEEHSVFTTVFNQMLVSIDSSYCSVKRSHITYVFQSLFEQTQETKMIDYQELLLYSHGGFQGKQGNNNWHTVHQLDFTKLESRFHISCKCHVSMKPHSFFIVFILFFSNKHLPLSRKIMGVLSPHPAAAFLKCFVFVLGVSLFTGDKGTSNCMLCWTSENITAARARGFLRVCSITRAV